jgi:hypothetical protein
MFAPLIAICLLGVECNLFTRADKKMYQTYEECEKATTKDVKEIWERLRSRNIDATIGFKCEVPKDRV